MKLTKYTLYKTILGQSLGLMFSHKKTIVFEFKNERKVSLHTFFVFFPITVLFLNSEKKIVEHTVMKPFRFYFPTHKSKYIVELPFETQKKIGEKVRFDYREL